MKGLTNKWKSKLVLTNQKAMWWRWQFPPPQKIYHQNSYQLCIKISTGCAYKWHQADPTVYVGMKQGRRVHTSQRIQGQVERSAPESLIAESDRTRLVQSQTRGQHHRVLSGDGYMHTHTHHTSAPMLSHLATDYQVHPRRKAETL